MLLNNRKYIPAYLLPKINSNVNKNIFDDLIKAIPLFTALFIFLGFVDIATYYGSFGINIVEYITLGEILLLFLNKVYLILFIILFPFFYSFISNSERDKIFNSIDRLLTSPTFEKRHFWYSFFLLMFISIPLNPGNESSALFKICFVLNCFVIVQFLFVCIYKFCKKKRINTIYAFLGTFIFFFISFFPFYNILIKVPEMINGKSTTYQIEFNYKDKLTKTDSNFIYIGSIQSFVFCFDRKAMQTNVFKKEDIKDLKINLK